MVNLMMARQGLAVPLVLPPNVQYVEVIRAAADPAREAGLGLWAVEAFACLPEAFRDGLCGATAPLEPTLPTRPLPVAGSSRGDCDPSYPDVCIPSPPPDHNCGNIRDRKFRVIGSDPHHFDGDHNGIGCESVQQ
jgi:micrococcal nuclease